MYNYLFNNKIKTNKESIFLKKTIATKVLIFARPALNLKRSNWHFVDHSPINCSESWFLRRMVNIVGISHKNSRFDKTEKSMVEYYFENPEIFQN